MRKELGAISVTVDWVLARSRRMSPFSCEKSWVLFASPLIECWLDLGGCSLFSILVSWFNFQFMMFTIFMMIVHICFSKVNLHNSYSLCICHFGYIVYSLSPNLVWLKNDIVQTLDQSAVPKSDRSFHNIVVWFAPPFCWVNSSW